MATHDQIGGDASGLAQFIGVVVVLGILGYAFIFIIQLLVFAAALFVAALPIIVVVCVLILLFGD